MIDDIPYVFCIWADFKAKSVCTLFIDRVLVGIDDNIKSLTELMHFTQVEKLAQVERLIDLYVSAFLLILQFVILVIHNYVEMMNG